jgi:hypothetical protein
MFTKISSLTLAILMFLVFFGSTTSPWVFMAAVAGIVLSTLAINYRRLNFTWPHLMLPALFLLATACIYVVIPDHQWKITFLALASIAFFMMEVRLGRESHLLQNLYLYSAFGLFLGLFGAQFYLRLPVYLFVIAVFIASFILSIQGFTGFQLPAKKYFYLVIGITCAEVAFGLTFWPTHFFVNTVVLFLVFYILWLFSFSAFFGKLTRAKIFWQLTLVSIILFITLITAAWKPLS